MKVMGFEEFAVLPPGTIFSYFEPMVVDGLFRKGDTILHDGKPGDYFEGFLTAQCWNGEPPTVDDIESRWGAFDYSQQYAVYEPEDIATLCRMLGCVDSQGDQSK